MMIAGSSIVNLNNLLLSVNAVCVKNKFVCQSELFRHIKHEHRNLVQMCRDEKNGACIFGSLNCWFIHDDKEVTFESDKALN